MLTKDCSVFRTENGSEETLEYRSCLAGNGVKEYEFRMGMEAYLVGNYKEAIGYFRSAAVDEPKVISIYQPPVGNQKYGSILRIDNGMAEAGHKGAKYMLSEIYRYGRGVKINEKRADAYLKESLGTKVVITERADHFEIIGGFHSNFLSEVSEYYRFMLEEHNRDQTKNDSLRRNVGFKVMKRPGQDI